MKLSDQEQVILRAIEKAGSNGIAEISKVIKAVGYPKAITKRTIARLTEKGLVAIHRHDWPRSLTPAQRKLMLRIGKDYFSAVSIRERNPMGKPKSKTKTALKTTGRALKGFARGALSSASQILGAGATALNPVRRRVRNKYIDLVIKGQAKKTPDGWRVGKKTFAQGRGTVNVSSGYYLDRHTGTVYAKRARNSDKKDSDHPIEVTKHWRAGPPGYLTPWQRAHHAGQAQLFETGIKPAKRNKSKKKASKRSAARSVNPRKSKASRVRAVSKTRNRAGVRSVAKTRKRATKRITRNPSAESIRKEFAGSVSGSKDLFFPQGTPKGQLAKLGKLVLIQTEQGTIKPVHGSAWLCADTKGKLHIGSVSGAPLFDGPARSFGHVTKLEYESSKPHLGYKGPIIWFHKVGEENHIRPILRADGKGGLVFKGGDYRLTRRGIEN